MRNQATRLLHVVITKPNGYGSDSRGNGPVQRYRWGTMPNGTLPHLASLIPSSMNGVPIAITLCDEYVQTDLQYLKLLRASPDPMVKTLVLLCGVQSWQFQRAMDLAALAHSQDCMVVVGGPHMLTCITEPLYGRGISFGLSEGELILRDILSDAIRGELAPCYGEGQRWSPQLESSLIEPPNHEVQKRYAIKMIGFNIASGCPFTCSFCSVFEAYGNVIRERSLDNIIRNLLNFKAKGVKIVMFTSDNFNKIPRVKELLRMMIDAKINIPFFSQCDTQLENDEELIELMAQAGATQVFIGLESLTDENLKVVHKIHNLGTSKIDVYHRTQKLIGLLRKYGINSQIATIVGFPHDTRATILNQIGLMKELDPDIGSFYILTPIPGTKDYKKYKEEGLLREKNMDMYDCTRNVWDHPNLSPHELKDLLYESYQQFYTPRHFLDHAKRIYARKKPGVAVDLLISFMYNAFSRYAAWRQFHPLGGGFGRVTLDHSKDYAELREEYFGDITDENGLFPLPEKREISASETQMNKDIRNSRRSLPVMSLSQTLPST